MEKIHGKYLEAIGGRISDSQSYVFLNAKYLKNVSPDIDPVISPTIEIYIHPRDKAKIVGYTTGNLDFGLHLLLDNSQEEFVVRVLYRWKDWEGNEHFLEQEKLTIRPSSLSRIQPDEKIRRLLSGEYCIDVY